MPTATALRAAAGTSAGPQRDVNEGRIHVDQDLVRLSSQVPRAEVIRPFGTGVLIRASQAAQVDIEVTGAANAAIVVDGTSFAAIMASDVHDNSDAALTIRCSASARRAHNVLMRNGTSERVRRSFIIDDGANLLFTGNVFQDVSRDHVGDSRDGARGVAGRDNWSVDEARSTFSVAPRIPRGRG